jgi:hypothetical protein
MVWAPTITFFEWIQLYWCKVYSMKFCAEDLDSLIPRKIKIRTMDMGA